MAHACKIQTLPLTLPSKYWLMTRLGIRLDGKGHHKTATCNKL